MTLPRAPKPRPLNGREVSIADELPYADAFDGTDGFPVPRCTIDGRPVHEVPAHQACPCVPCTAFRARGTA